MNSEYTSLKLTGEMGAWVINGSSVYSCIKWQEIGWDHLKGIFSQKSKAKKLENGEVNKESWEDATSDTERKLWYLVPWKPSKGLQCCWEVEWDEHR